MILLLLFLASSLFLGYVLSLRMKFLASAFEKAAGTVIMGLPISTLLAFALSFALRSLSTTSILISIIANLLLSFVIMKKLHVKLAVPRFSLGKTVGWPEIVALLVFLLLAYFNSLSIYEDAEGGIWGISNTWADYALHVGIINSFAIRDNFPPVYPNLAGAQMRYPFLADFLSAIFVKEGIGIALSITIPNLLLIFSLVALTYSFLKKFSGKREIAAIALVLFLLNGNLGFLNFLQDFSAAENKAAFLSDLPKAYSYLPEENIHFMNLTYSVFIPQRSVLMGFPLVMLIFLMLLRVHNGEAEKHEYFLAGLLTSILPLVHASSFAVAGFAGMCFFIFSRFGKGRPGAPWGLFFLPLLLIAIPQLAFINEQWRSPEFMGPEVGWMSRAADFGGWANFWRENTGITLVLGLIGLFLISRQQLIFSLPFFFIFLGANLVRLQPWEWDNVKVFMYWLLVFCGIAATATVRIAESVRSISNKKRMRKILSLLSSTLIFLLVFIGTFSALLTYLKWNDSNAAMWSADERKIAGYIELNTPENALFLTAGKHNQLVYTLAGRQILAGYDGHLWSHGLNFREEASVSREIYSTADASLAEKWGIDYVYIGWAELREWNANLQAFRGSSAYEEIYTNEKSGVYIFKVRK